MYKRQNEKWNQPNQELQQVKEDVYIQINNVEEDNIIRIESLQKETQEDTERVQARIGERIEDINANMNSVKCQIINNKEKIEEIHQRELVNIREELEMIRSRPFSISNVQPDVYKRQTIHHTGFGFNLPLNAPT